MVKSRAKIKVEETLGEIIDQQAYLLYMYLDLTKNIYTRDGGTPIGAYDVENERSSSRSGTTQCPPITFQFLSLLCYFMLHPTIAHTVLGTKHVL